MAIVIGSTGEIQVVSQQVSANVSVPTANILSGATQIASLIEGYVGTLNHEDFEGRYLAGQHPASSIEVISAEFDGNLSPEDDDLQKIVTKLDDFDFGGAIHLVLAFSTELLGPIFEGEAVSDFSVTLDAFADAPIGGKLLLWEGIDGVGNGLYSHEGDGYFTWADPQPSVGQIFVGPDYTTSEGTYGQDGIWSVSGVDPLVVVQHSGPNFLNSLLSKALPAGGFEGQALFKTSDDDYDVDWADVPIGDGGGGGGGETVTELRDLTDVETAARLAGHHLEFNGDQWVPLGSPVTLASWSSFDYTVTEEEGEHDWSSGFVEYRTSEEGLDTHELRGGSSVLFDGGDGAQFFYGARQTEPRIPSILYVESSDGGETWSLPSSTTVTPGEHPYICKHFLSDDDPRVWLNSDGKALIFATSKRHDLVSASKGINLFERNGYSGGGLTLVDEVIDRGPDGSWCDATRFAPVVFYHNNKLHMLFNGANDVGVEAVTAIGRAVSSDEGLTWDIDEGPLLAGALYGEGLNARDLAVSEIIRVRGAWVMLAIGYDFDSTSWKSVRFVTTDDPMDWTFESWTLLPVSDFYKDMRAWGNDPTKAIINNNGASWQRISIVQPEDVEEARLVAIEEKNSDQDDRLDSVEGSIESIGTTLSGVAGDISTINSNVDAIDGRVSSVEAAVENKGDVEHFVVDVGAHITQATGSFSDLGPLFSASDTLSASSDLDLDGGISVTFESFAGNNAGAVLFAPASPVPGASLIGVRLKSVNLSTDSDPEGAGLAIVLVNSFAPVAGRVLYSPAGGDTEVSGWATGALTVASPSTGVVADVSTVDILLAFDEFVSDPSSVVLGLTMFAGEPETAEINGFTVAVDSVEWLWKMPELNFVHKVWNFIGDDSTDVFTQDIFSDLRQCHVQIWSSVEPATPEQVSPETAWQIGVDRSQIVFDAAPATGEDYYIVISGSIGIDSETF